MNVIDILVGCSEEHDNVFQVDLLVMVLINLSKDFLQQKYSEYCHCETTATLYSFILSSAAMQGEGGMVPQR